MGCRHQRELVCPRFAHGPVEDQTAALADPPAPVLLPGTRLVPAFHARRHRLVLLSWERQRDRDRLPSGHLHLLAALEVARRVRGHRVGAFFQLYGAGRERLRRAPASGHRNGGQGGRDRYPQRAVTAQQGNLGAGDAHRLPCHERLPDGPRRLPALAQLDGVLAGAQVRYLERAVGQDRTHRALIDQNLRAGRAFERKVGRGRKRNQLEHQLLLVSLSDLDGLLRLLPEARLRHSDVVLLRCALNAQLAAAGGLVAVLLPVHEDIHSVLARRQDHDRPHVLVGLEERRQLRRGAHLDYPLDLGLPAHDGDLVRARRQVAELQAVGRRISGRRAVEQHLGRRERCVHPRLPVERADHQSAGVLHGGWRAELRHRAGAQREVELSLPQTAKELHGVFARIDGIEGHQPVLGRARLLVVQPRFGVVEVGNQPHGLRQGLQSQFDRSGRARLQFRRCRGRLVAVQQRIDLVGARLVFQLEVRRAADLAVHPDRRSGRQGMNLQAHHRRRRRRLLEKLGC